MKDEYLEDFISGVRVSATPEEVEAVQVFSRMLVDDYGYPKALIRTRPQWRVRARPSDSRKEYPVDIAVFSTQDHKDENIWIIVECKKASRKDGRTQLEDYLRFSTSRLGVWFNGHERLFLEKTEAKGKVEFKEIPNIPKHGERIKDVGLYKRKDLKPAHNLKSVFRTIRNYFAANAVGITRDEVFAQQIINLIFCKIYDERFTRPDDTVKFRAGIDEKPFSIKKRIRDLFDHVKQKYSDVIDKGDKIDLDDNVLTYAVGELQMFCLIESERDAIADAFETFIGPSLKGGQGQFFTPRNMVRLIVGMVDPGIDDRVIDPACGSGGFLVETIRNVWTQIDAKGEAYGWPDSEVATEKQEAAIKNFRGIDKDYFLSKVAKAYMAIIGDGRGGVFCENSLEIPTHWHGRARENAALGSFDVVVTNPPFGKKLKIDDTTILGSYQLGYTKNRGAGVLRKTQSPQILFTERCLELLKDGGRLGIIAPESMFCNPSHRYIVEYIKSIARIKAVVSLPEELFQPYTHAKTCAVIIEKLSTDHQVGHEIFMAVARWCGHDSRGLLVPHDDLPRIFGKYLDYKKTGGLSYDHWGFIINESEIRDNIYLPKYYNPVICKKLRKLQKTHDFLVFGDLVQQGAIDLSTGHEVGKLCYGTGNIPFVRTSDIANWEIRLDPKHRISQAVFEEYRKRQDVRESDILMVRDGTYLVGTCALITRHDTKIVYQSHFYKIRSNEHKTLHPYLLLAALTCPIVKEQIYARRFTQDIIDTLGGRIHELVLPIPKSPKLRANIIERIRSVFAHKDAARELARKTILGIAPTTDDHNDDGFLTMSK